MSRPQVSKTEPLSSTTTQLRAPGCWDTDGLSQRFPNNRPLTRADCTLSLGELVKNTHALLPGPRGSDLGGGRVLGRAWAPAFYQLGAATCLELGRDPETSVPGTPGQSGETYEFPPQNQNASNNITLRIIMEINYAEIQLSRF